MTSSKIVNKRIFSRIIHKIIKAYIINTNLIFKRQCIWKQDQGSNWLFVVRILTRGKDRLYNKYIRSHGYDAMIPLTFIGLAGFADRIKRRKFLNPLHVFIWLCARTQFVKHAGT